MANSWAGASKPGAKTMAEAVEVATKGESVSDFKTHAVLTECPGCKRVGAVVRAHDEDGDVLLDTFVVAHGEFYDCEEACWKVDDHCGPFLWEELQRTQRVDGGEIPGRTEERRNQPAEPETGGEGG